MSDTPEKLLLVAEALFSERGFYGVSIAAIASELGITKQALLFLLRPCSTTLTK